MKNGVYVFKKDAIVEGDLQFKKGQEIEVVGGVVYMGGFPLPFPMQQKIITWMDNNLDLFMTDNRNF